MVRVMRLTLVLGLIGLSALLFACSSDDSESDEPASTAVATETSSESATTTVGITLSDFAIEATATSVPAGDVRFEAENTGATPHELVIIKTDLAADQLPVEGGKVDESDVGGVGEIEEFPAGESQAASFELTSGSYVLICNVAGHYQLGMYTSFTVE